MASARSIDVRRSARSKRGSTRSAGEPVSSYLQTFDTVSGSTPVLPIPTLAASIRLTPELALGFGVWAPYAALSSYPERVNGAPAPQRYALFTLEGSALAFLRAQKGRLFFAAREPGKGHEPWMSTGSSVNTACSRRPASSYVKGGLPSSSS